MTQAAWRFDWRSCIRISCAIFSTCSAARVACLRSWRAAASEPLVDAALVSLSAQIRAQPLVERLVAYGGDLALLEEEAHGIAFRPSTAPARANRWRRRLRRNATPHLNRSVVIFAQIREHDRKKPSRRLEGVAAVGVARPARHFDGQPRPTMPSSGCRVERALVATPRTAATTSRFDGTRYGYTSAPSCRFSSCIFAPRFSTSSPSSDSAVGNSSSSSSFTWCSTFSMSS